MKNKRQLVDWHSHVWTPEQLGPTWGHELDAKYMHTPSASGSVEMHAQAMREAGIERSIVIALTSDHLRFDIPNEYVAEYVASNPTQLRGVGSVDPNRPDSAASAEYAFQDLKLRGLKLAPPYQNFHPHSAEAYKVYEVVASHGGFLIFHQGAVTHKNGVLEVASPILLDKVARDFPELPIIIAHVGQPWFTETITLLRKHSNVWADISARCSRPAQLRSILEHAIDYGTESKLLFGSDFPTFSVTEHIAGLRASVSSGSDEAHKITDELVDSILYHRPLSLLGME